jgi:ubiquinone/menaquinone biosynthesis C-methylase UbiE
MKNMSHDQSSQKNKLTPPPGRRPVEDLRDEYNRLYREAPIRDEDRAYAWIARQVHRIQPRVRDVLDVACGGGYFLRELARVYGASARFRGIDFSGEALAIARKEFPSAECGLSAAEDMPFGPESFDLITCLGSLEHFLNIEQALAEIRRTLRPGGIFLAMVPNIMWYRDILAVLFTGTRKSRNQTHELFASDGEWRGTLAQNGFEVVRMLKYNGIARAAWKQFLKDLLVPSRFSYHFIYFCRKKAGGKAM